MRSKFQASLRDAEAMRAPIRGLKATATIKRSLRDPPGQSKVVGNAEPVGEGWGALPLN